MYSLGNEQRDINTLWAWAIHLSRHNSIINKTFNMSQILDSVSRKPEDLLRLADIHPELAAFLEANKTQGPPPSPPPTDVVSIRKMYEKLTTRSFDKRYGPDSAIGVKIEEKTVTARDGFEIPIRTYRPDSSALEPGPLIIAFHGGARVCGGLIDEEGHCHSFVKVFGASCVNVDYRLAPEYKLPIGADDCFDVTKWAATHADELGADPKKGFILQGLSAGACMADYVLHVARDEKLNPPITGAVEIVLSAFHSKAVPEEYKPEYLSWDQELTHTLSRESITQAAEWYGGEQNPTAPSVSPFLWPSGHTGLPPIFFQTAGRDHLRDTSLIYEKRLREVDGVLTRLKVYPGLPHGFNQIYPDLEVSKQHDRHTLEGIKWLLSFSN
jgi:acetyl esterase/lipase